ncbi:uncharacterized protein LOC132178015 [Corylus avellana]|uniref:uncharacterized protein LOC132178015 n=1 Tax=Corylus avellana TaxID=13451 RepID=UPI00286C3EAB|nr:uncharacterized protein LOC132178015 [Corylus avellana]
MEIQRVIEQIFSELSVQRTVVENDGDEKVVCNTCRKPISGRAFTFRSRHLFHLTCLNSPINCKDFVSHYGKGHDRLIFTKEHKADGKEDVVCNGCEKPALGPGFKCSTLECNLFLHESCVKLPLKIQHPFHPNHALDRMMPKKKHCTVCGKSCNTYVFYSCGECDFNLDIACATTLRINCTHDCKHTFIYLFNKVQFTCQACGEECKDLASLCTTCQLLIHGKCARFSCIIKITRHDHSLTLTYSLRQLKEPLDNNVFCKLCYQKVKTEYAAYCCQKCDYVAHLDCALEDEESAFLKLVHESVDLATNAMLVEVAGKIKHFSHDQHHLILSNEELMGDKLCDGCMKLISTPFYSCTQCNFFLHIRCAQLPKRKRYQHHDHPLTLNSQGPLIGGLFRCHACDNVRHGFTYTCDMCRCELYLDVHCCSIPETLKHEGHQHSLFLAINSNQRCHVCNCSSSEKPGIFICIECDFALGFECATLPLVARQEHYDDHLLKLTYIAEKHCGEYYCLICEKERYPNHWFYYCAICDFSAHSECVLGKYPYVKFGSTFMVKNDHQHPLTFVPKTESSRPCDACECLTARGKVLYIVNVASK